MTTETERSPDRNQSFQTGLFRNPLTAVGVVVGGLGFLVGIGFVIWQAIAVRMPFWQSLLAIALPAIFIIVATVVILPMARQNRLMSRGRPARAVIAGLRDTGLTVNQNPQVRFELDVQLPDGRTYRTTTKAVVSRLITSLYIPGTEVDVMVDPRHPKRVALVDLASGSTGRSALSQDQTSKVLAEIDAYNQRLRATGESAHATVVRADPIGVMVNGRNPAMKFVLRVYPAGATPFMAEAAGVVAEQSVVKCQPGCDILVRFEDANRTRVGLDHT